MGKADYYNRYWKKDVEAKNLTLPPTWDEQNLIWHYRFFEPFIKKAVLDVGGGDGSFLNYLTLQNDKIKRAVSSDLSEQAIKIGQKKYPNLEFRQENLEKLKFKDGEFDTVFGIEVVEHLYDIDLCLSEINRVLKKSGYFCVTTTDFNWLKKVIIAGLFWDRFFYPNNAHIRFFTKKTLKQIAEKHGFELVKYRWNHSYLGIMPKGQMVVFQKIGN